MRYYKEKNRWWCELASGARYRVLQYKCYECGKKFPRLKSLVKNPARVFCSKRCSNQVTGRLHATTRLGAGGPMWKGGRKKVSGGYIRIYKPEHPAADTHHCVLEHRVVMEQILGRYLYPFETVHHKNGVRDDNRPENLQLFVSKHPAGQTPEDLVIWAREILELYRGYKPCLTL